jgi:hypothetical protein
LLAAWIFIRRYRARLAQRHRRVSEQIEELVKSFPASVRSWGGAAALQKPSRVQEILAALQAQKM